ncbi:TetR/AcrR family transcriptional regulator [Halodesulfurarchaeum sp. HSR-GB]|uniref:TetR/AcrR family transcriptional regulator n=1 Tax=Halodesulfurarchaeum sp. HSR-GB TaxID=3074077 RepID=UPI002858E8D7|nr:TetR/AcrR family transcriptional regulator [Halodesulfurarchaeum sp. HSR-GB]MDR5656685.1 TetR/AcrR family transcriptional regulator [Halodesulfurarchaeum sp. HSR-GB]
MKGFSDDERAQIRAELIEAGKELFTAIGLERTRVRDLTDEVGIGTSTFYQFFDSKGTLYLTVLDHEVERIAQSYEGKLDSAPDIRSEVRLGLEALFEELETNPLFYRAVVENERQQLLRNLPPEQQRGNFKEGRDTLVTLAERWTSNPQFQLDDPVAVVDLLRLLSQTVRLREQFETLSTIEEYESARNVLIDSLVHGLTDQEHTED